MPQGLPEAGDQGLDRTRTWGRTYWGGAIFWLLADVEIREATHNQKGLRDAMRGILNAGGNITEDWTVERVAEVGDQATGTTVIADLYKQMKGTAVHTDLDDLWRRLGVQVKNGAATFDDGAPLAEIRKAITAK
jgi:predicted metalloprotease with PDZ domain